MFRNGRKYLLKEFEYLGNEMIFLNIKDKVLLGEKIVIFIIVFCEFGDYNCILWLSFILKEKLKGIVFNGKYNCKSIFKVESYFYLLKLLII